MTILIKKKRRMSEKQLSKNKVIYKNVTYSIDEEKCTAELLKCGRNLYDIIPRSFVHETKEYIVISILEYAFTLSLVEDVKFAPDSQIQTIENNAFSNSTIKSITIPSSVTFIGENAFNCCKQFQQIEIPDNSKLQTIEKNTFFDSTIENITIPSELVELKDEWCKNTPKLTKIKVSQLNPRYCCYEDKIIIGKTNNDQNNYDCLIFCARDTQHIKIPNFIEHICSCSFENCKQLEEIEFPNDSKLQTIDKYAFSETAIKRIIIPSSVTLIDEYAFSNCQQLQIIEIPNDSKLQTIGACAFSQTAIENIIISSSVTSIGEYAFSDCDQLYRIEISSDIKLQSIDKYAFSYVAIDSIFIPSSITFIKDYAFYHCDQLQIIEINNAIDDITIHRTAFGMCKTPLLMTPVCL